MIAAALAAGALGAKVTGAGGGGCMIALVDGDDAHATVQRALVRRARQDGLRSGERIMSQYKATALARANIALAKYWGKSDVALNLPAVPSISITLEPMRTETTVDVRRRR